MTSEERIKLEELIKESKNISIKSKQLIEKNGVDAILNDDLFNELIDLHNQQNVKIAAMKKLVK